MTTLLVFIHGFMGSGESFLKFPADLSILLNYKGHDVETLTYEYETKGNNQRQVQKLMDYLMFHGSSTKYKSVFLLAHSMGGILALDAYQSLYQIHDKSYFYDHQHPHTGDDMRVLTRIKGIIAFDSPFFGLANNVILSTGVQKAAGVVKLAPALVKSMDLSLDKIVPETINVPVKGVQVPVSTKWLKDQIFNSSGKLVDKDALSALDTQKIPLESMNDPKKINVPKLESESATETSLTVVTETKESQWQWSHLAGMGALATTALSTLGFMTPMVSSLAISNLDTVQDYSAFLDPLLSKSKRIEIIIKEHKEQKVYFRAFYNELKDKRTFCSKPSMEEHKEFFDVFESHIEDEIDAHMYMFDLDILGDSKYKNMLDRVSQKVDFAIQSIE
jgi:hypothetical protein